MEEKQLYLFDIDGTLSLGDTWIDGAHELLDTIRSKGKKFVFITNNSTKSVDDYINKFKRMNLDTETSNIMTAGMATCAYLCRNYGDKKIYVVGTKSYVQELKKHGLKITESAEEAQLLLAAYDSELTYQKLVDATHILNRKDTIFIATNPDLVCPDPEGFIPDCGSMCNMLEIASGRKPKYIGKPDTYMLELIFDEYKVEKSQCVVVGDRLYTDILCGYNAGIDTIAVLTGETNLEEINKSTYKPTYIMESVKDIVV